MTRISYVNGKFLRHEKCFVHIEDRGFQFADGAYEVTLFEKNQFIDGIAHMQRLMRSLAQLNIEHDFTAEELLKIQQKLMAKNNYTQNATCYIQITRGQHSRTPNCPKNIKPSIIITASERKIVSENEFERGFSAATCTDIRWHRCDIKTVNLLASTLCNQKAKDQGFDDAIFVRDNFVTEATFANVFMVDNKNNLITHPADNNILCGITRNRLIEIAKSHKINVIEKKFTIEEMYTANEVFLTSSSLIIRPLNKINQHSLKNFHNIKSSIALLLKKQYENFIEQHNTKKTPKSKKPNPANH